MANTAMLDSTKPAPDSSATRRLEMKFASGHQAEMRVSTAIGAALYDLDKELG